MPSDWTFVDKNILLNASGINDSMLEYYISSRSFGDLEQACAANGLMPEGTCGIREARIIGNENLWVKFE